MRIFLAGATGAIGTRLTPQLVAAGHEVIGTTTTTTKLPALEAQGAEGVVLDALDGPAVRAAVVEARPDVVMHQLTALSGTFDLKRFDDTFALTNRLRTEALDHLLAGAREAGAKRFVAQSYTGWTNPRTGGWVKTEDDGLDPDPVPATLPTIDAIRHLEEVTVAAEGLDGVVLRFGQLYGPGTSWDVGGSQTEAVRGRKLPVVGGGAGVWSFVHVDDAAAATVAALDRGAPGVYNVVDDDPAPVGEIVPAVAQILGVRPPTRVPAWLVRPMIGPAGVAMMTQVRGSSNERAKRELGWAPRYASWRDGLAAELGRATPGR